MSSKPIHRMLKNIPISANTEKTICNLTSTSMAAIYVHIPFCKQACHYCDFHFSTDLRDTHDMVAAICREAELRRDYLGTEAVETVYFGGGTPSLLSKRDFSTVLEALHRLFPIRPDREFTVEVNPDDLNREKIR